VLLLLAHPVFNWHKSQSSYTDHFFVVSLSRCTWHFVFGPLVAVTRPGCLQTDHIPTLTTAHSSIHNRPHSYHPPSWIFKLGKFGTFLYQIWFKNLSMRLTPFCSRHLFDDVTWTNFRDASSHKIWCNHLESKVIELNRNSRWRPLPS